MSPKELCFMIMPFGIKETGAEPPLPAKINFDALWEKALLPTIEAMGYQPIRADQDLGALIINEMLERLYFSDLVLADLTIPNGNVYYEVGIRHAAKNEGCVLISADWSKQLFDVAQMRQVRYPLPVAEVSDETAKQIQAILKEGIKKLKDGQTPMFEVLPGYPGKVATDRAGVIRGFLEALSNFQAQVRSVRHAPVSERRSLALALHDQQPAETARIPSVALEILFLLRDCAGWQETIDYIDNLPNSIRDLAVVREQRSLALSKTGDHLDAIGALEELIKTTGDSSERQGLLGGRYKKLYANAAPTDKRRFLNEAIKHYEKGMSLDLNDYYPSCNLPALYRERNKKGDDALALQTALVARLACERAIQLKLDDDWTRPTLLVLAFFEGNVDRVEEICDEIEVAGAATWKLETTIKDLERIVGQTPDQSIKAELQSALDRLKALLPPETNGK